MNHIASIVRSSLVLCTLASPVVVSAADPPPPPIVTRVNEAFASIDANHDGAMTFAEYRDFVFAAFAAADADGNLTLTLSEIGADAGDRLAFAKIDRAKKGEVTLAEFMRMQRLLFDFADLDLNGSVSREEYLAIMLASGYGWIDADGDHRLNRAEYVSVLANLFAALDADRSGSLSAAEYAVFAATRPASASPDGSVSPAAFIEDGLRALPADMR
ncbi:MAG: EF-hand domain-containing protein [Phycisphaerales bacterium]